MSELSTMIVGAANGLALGLGLWTRKAEVDREGNPSLCYLGPRYGFPICALFGIYSGVKDLMNPARNSNSVGHYVLFGYAGLCLLASIYFVFYRVSLKAGTIERSRWPRASKLYDLRELTRIGEVRGETVLFFESGETLKIPMLASGKARFVDQLEAIFVSGKAHRSRGSGIRK